jgi:hypothetical protein
MHECSGGACGGAHTAARIMHCSIASRGTACAECDPCPVAAEHGMRPQHGLRVDNWRADTAGTRDSVVGERARTAIDRREAGAVGRRGLRPAQAHTTREGTSAQALGGHTHTDGWGAARCPCSHHTASAARTQLRAGRWNTLLIPPARAIHAVAATSRRITRACKSERASKGYASDREAARARRGPHHASRAPSLPCSVSVGPEQIPCPWAPCASRMLLISSPSALGPAMDR